MTRQNHLHYAPISLNIMAHPKRTWMVDELLDGPLASIEPTVLWALPEESVWATRQRCLIQHLQRSDSQFAVTIQDDAILGYDFLNRMVNFLSAHNSDSTYAVNLFFWSTANTNAMRQARELGYYESHSMRGGVVIGLPTHLIPDLISRENAHKWWRSGDEKINRNDDGRISNYLRARRVKVRYPVPSLADHRDEESLIYGRGEFLKARKASTYVG